MNIATQKNFNKHLHINTYPARINTHKNGQEAK